ncbi:MAG: hypothetical protein GF317_15615 [Candidatus Lokiarchaeota archaeon]|nr:hypothetical protein [Candidatus Lokiarchaeota archaeon]MBD3200991.1 hypothetical protein [Candidatus Lokiarchaeota archaeon]
MSTNPYADIFFYTPVMVLGGLTLIAFIAFLNKRFRIDQKKLKKYSNLKEKFLVDTKKDNEPRECGECGGKIDNHIKICPHCDSKNSNH